jgi:hypothetical protein
MKHIVILFFITLLTTSLFSCVRKNYLCECTGDLFGDALIINNASKTDAKKQCDQFEKDGKGIYSDKGCTLKQK